jgi:hypothetical protein
LNQAFVPLIRFIEMAEHHRGASRELPEGIT